MKRMEVQQGPAWADILFSSDPLVVAMVNLLFFGVCFGGVLMLLWMDLTDEEARSMASNLSYIVSVGMATFVLREASTLPYAVDVVLGVVGGFILATRSAEYIEEIAVQLNSSSSSSSSPFSG